MSTARIIIIVSSAEFAEQLSNETPDSSEAVVPWTERVERSRQPLPVLHKVRQVVEIPANTDRIRGKRRKSIVL